MLSCSCSSSLPSCSPRPAQTLLPLPRYPVVSCFLFTPFLIFFSFPVVSIFLCLSNSFFVIVSSFFHLFAIILDRFFVLRLHHPASLPHSSIIVFVCLFVRLLVYASSISTRCICTLTVLSAYPICYCMIYLPSFHYVCSQSSYQLTA